MSFGHYTKSFFRRLTPTNFSFLRAPPHPQPHPHTHPPFHPHHRLLQTLSCLNSSLNSSLKSSLNSILFLPQKSFSTSIRLEGLKDFFDEETNWNAESVKVGRAWKVEELRIKSNSDLHKLWFVLLREVNMLLTMEEECRRVGVLFPAPDRLDKCEESMEKVLEVVKERDDAFNLLETGRKAEPRKEWRYNMLGQPEIYEHKEHLLPKHLNEDYEENRMGYPEDNEQWIWRFREQELHEKHLDEEMKLERLREMKEIWPDNEELQKVSDPNPRKEDFS